MKVATLNCPDCGFHSGDLYSDNTASSWGTVGRCCENCDSKLDSIKVPLGCVFILEEW